MHMSLLRREARPRLRPTIMADEEPTRRHLRKKREESPHPLPSNVVIGLSGGGGRLIEIEAIGERQGAGTILGHGVGADACDQIRPAA